MVLDNKTLDKLADLICGDGLAAELCDEDDSECPCYRKGRELPTFFNDAGLECPPFQNDTRKWWTLARLEEYNKDPKSMEKVLLRLSHPKEYYNQRIHGEVLKSLNELLALDGCKIILNGTEPELVYVNSYMPENVVKNDYKIDIINFDQIVYNQLLCSILEIRWKEIETCISHGAYLASIILMGSILEGILLDFVENNPKDANKSKFAPKYSSGKNKSFKDWTLNDLINVSHECGWMDKDIKDFNSALRDYRNLVHPRKQRDDAIFPDNDTSNICLHVVYAALNDLKDNKP